MHKGELSKETVAPIETNSTTKRNQRADSTSTTSVSERTSRLQTEMHIYRSTEINHKVYEKELAQIGPRKGSTRFMCETVEQVERRKLSHGQIPKTDKNIWKSSEEDMWNQKTGSISSTRNYHNGGQQGHLQKKCPIRKYCKEIGHSYKDRGKRNKDAKEKCCAKCKMKRFA